MILAHARKVNTQLIILGLQYITRCKKVAYELYKN